MLNWEDELKRFVVKKFREVMGYDISLNNIHTIKLDLELDFDALCLIDLAHIYAFALMKEEFENAQKISDELTKRNCRIELNTNEEKKTGEINIYVEESSVPEITVPLKVYPDGIMIDFEKDESF